MVANHASSVWFGVPVAYIGLFGYLAIAGVSIWRSVKGTEQSQKPMLLGFILSIVALAIQFGLTLYAILVIKDSCSWCLGSTAIVFLLFLVHIILMQMHALGKTIAPSKTSFDWSYGAALAIAAFGLVGFQGARMKAEASVTPISEEAKNLLQMDSIVPENAHIYGNVDAPITVVEFADMFCPACRRIYPAIHDYVQQSNGRVRLVFRHMPMPQLQGHELALNASVMGEIAGEEGKFFEYLDAVYSAPEEEVRTMEGLKGILKGLGIDAEKAMERSYNAEDPAFQRMYRDIEFTSNLGVQITPSFVILAEGIEPFVANGNNVIEVLNSDKYAEIE